MTLSNHQLLHPARQNIVPQSFLTLMALIFGLVLMAIQPAQAQDVVERKELQELIAPTVETDSTVTGTSSNSELLTDPAWQPMPPEAEVAQSNENSTLGNSIELLDHKPPLRIGMLAERGATYLQGRIEPYRKYMQESLSRPVEIVAFSTMRMLMAAHTSRQIDYATYPASIFAMAHASCGCLLPLVAPVSPEAPDGTFMLLIVRGESGIKSLADMTGKSIALSSERGALPFYMALNELRFSGLDPDLDLASIVKEATPQDALSLLEKGEVDAALVWSTTQYNQNLFSSLGAVSAYMEAKKGKRKKAPPAPDFLSIWASPPVPAGPHAVHNEVSKQDRADLRTALNAMNQDDPAAYDAIERHHSGGFRTVTMDDYAPLIDIATAH